MNVFRGLARGPVAEDFLEDVEQHLHLEKAVGVKPQHRVIDSIDDAEGRLSLDAQAQAEGWQSHWHKRLEESCQEESKYNSNI
jgi:predicted RNA-binding protein with RPS1 domain